MATLAHTSLSRYFRPPVTPISDCIEVSFYDLLGAQVHASHFRHRSI